MLPERYTWGNFRRAMSNPGMFIDETRRTVHKNVSSHYFEYEYGSGVDVMAEDWDNLIILDACRYDAFEKINDITGALGRVVSHGSTSYEFIDKNFATGTFHDTVYVTANPKVERLNDETFYLIEKTYGDVDSAQQGRAPDNVQEMAVQAHENHPNKRLIVHFMQPHSPYIGPEAEQLRTEVENEFDVTFTKINRMRDRDSNLGSDELPSLLNAAQEGYIDDESLHRVYVENLELVLESVRELLEELTGKSIVTADHGEMLGDTSSRVLPHRYGHRPNAYVPELRLVPWLTVERDGRRTVTAEEPLSSEPVDEAVVEQQLEALGYK